MRLVQLVDKENEDFALINTDVSVRELEHVLRELSHLPKDDEYVELLIEKVREIRETSKCTRVFVDTVNI